MGKTYRSPSIATTSGGSIVSLSGMSRGQKIKYKTKRNCKAFGLFMYDKERKTVCNRTFKSWLFFLAFYSIFLGILVGSFFGAICGVTAYIKRHRTEPYFSKRYLIPDASPGVSIFPKLGQGLTPLIWYTYAGPNNENNARPEMYIEEIDKFFEKYKAVDRSTYAECSEKNKPILGQLCFFEIETLGPCGRNGYGYNDDKPCIYLKLNKLEGWTPECYTRISRLPHDIPETLPKQIEESGKKLIWVSCEGIKDFDRDHIGSIKYYPQQGFNAFHFPYDGSPNYLTPLVGVQLVNVSRGYVIGIRCSLWGKNIKMDDLKYHSTVIYIYIDLKKRN